MGIENFSEARKFAVKKLEEAQADHESGEEAPSLGTIDPAVVEHIFAVQAQIEKQGEMDYHEYAKQLWRDCLGKDPEESKIFSEFENRLISGLHQIPMRDLVYEDVRKSLPDLLKTYADSVKNIILWSSGDVKSTGYQAGKISRSRIVENFYLELIKHDREKAKKTMKEKTGYMVDDDKFKRLSEYIERLPQDQTIKLVVIEDNAKNIDRVRDLASGQFPNKNIEVIPIWAMHSREGQKAISDAEATGTQGELSAKKTALNSIDSFGDLLDKNRFGEVFTDAHVLVDFDGVIGDNVKMRARQADVIFGSLINAAQKETQLTAEELNTQIINNINGL